MDKRWKKALLWSSIGSVVMGAAVTVARLSSKPEVPPLHYHPIPDGSRRVSLWTEQFEWTEDGKRFHAQDHYLLQKTSFRVWSVLDLNTGSDAPHGQGSTVYHVTHSRSLARQEDQRTLEETRMLDRFYCTVGVTDGKHPAREQELARGGVLQLARCLVGGSPNGVETGEVHSSVRPLLHYRFDYEDSPVSEPPERENGSRPA